MFHERLHRQVEETGDPGLEAPLSELAIELFYPLDDATAALLRGLGDVTLGPRPTAAGVPTNAGRSGGPR